MTAPGDVPTDFFSLLRHPKYAPVFEEWLKEDHSYENLMFWREVEEFKELPPDQLPGAAAAIQTKYFELGSEYEINLDHHQKINLKEKCNNPTPDMFDEIQISIFLLMRLDSYPKFMESDKFRIAQGLAPKEVEPLEIDDSSASQDDERTTSQHKGMFSCLRA
jgi:regulator of G-protein signaling